MLSGMWNKWLLHIAGRKVKWYTNFEKQKQFGQCLTKLNVPLQYNPEIPNELKAYTHTKFCMQMFTEALFTTDKKKATPIPFNCWMSKQTVIQPIQCTTTWQHKGMKYSYTQQHRKYLICILQSERNQTKKDTEGQRTDRPAKGERNWHNSRGKRAVMYLDYGGINLSYDLFHSWCLPKKNVNTYAQKD